MLRSNKYNGVASGRESRRGKVARRSRLWEQIGKPEVMKRRHEMRALCGSSHTNRKKVDCRVHTICCRLVLHVHDVRSSFAHQSPDPR
jgi:hypothetical protein